MKHLRCSVWGCLGVTAVAFLTGCPRRQQLDWDKMLLDARTGLRQAAEDADPEVRTKALEALADTEGAAAGALMLQGLQDQRRPVRFAAAMAAGEVRYQPAKPILLAMAKDPQTPPKLLCAVIYALHRMGETTHTTKLGELLYWQDKWVRATAAMVMGKLDEPAAKEPLDALRRGERDPVVELQVVEALAALGDQRAAALLRAFTKSQFLEDRIIAVQGLGRVRQASSAYFLRKLLSKRKEHPAVRVAAAGSLAQLGELDGYDLAMRAATNPRKVLRSAVGRRARILQAETTNLQTLAILALGQMGEVDAVEKLHPLVFSTNGAVSVAACKSILQLLKKRRPAVTPPERPARPAPVTSSPPPSEEPVKAVVGPPGPPAAQPVTQPAEAPTEADAKPPSTQPSAPPTGPEGLHSSGAKD